MDCQLTEINRFRQFWLFPVTEINRSPFRGGRFSVIYFGGAGWPDLFTGATAQRPSRGQWPQGP